MKRLLIIMPIIFLIGCGHLPQERSEIIDAEGNVVSVPETMIYIYMPDGTVDTVKAFNTFASEGRIWWEDEDGFGHTTSLPTYTVDLQKNSDEYFTR